MATQTEKLLTQGQQFTDLSGRTGTVNFNAKTGERLSLGETTSIPASTFANQSSGVPMDASRFSGPVNTSVPQPINNTNAQNSLMAAVDSSIGSMSQVTNPEETAPAPTTQSSLLDRISQAIGLQSTKGEKTEALNEQEGVDAKKQAATDLENQILAKTRSYDKQIETIRANSEGKFGPAVDQEVSRIERLKNNELADLSIQYKVAAGAYNDAATLVQSKLDAEFEGYQNEISSLTNLYGLYQNDLTESEKMQAQAQIQEKQDTVTALRDAKETAYQTALANGAPTAVLASIGAATTPDAAYQAVGQYGVNPLDQKIQQAQLSNIYSQIAERNNPYNPEGTLNGKPQSATQASANGYAARLSESNVTLESLGSQFTGVGSQFEIPFIGTPNFLKSGDRQAYEQAQKNFVTAVLRRESGASIAPTEFETARDIYFPKAGDTPATVAQKAATRNTVINNFYREANVARPVLPGQIIESNGKRYKVAPDGQNLIEL